MHLDSDQEYIDKCNEYYKTQQIKVFSYRYKESEFNKGYKHFNAEEVETVHKMGMAYNAYNGFGHKKMSDVTIRLIMRYYEKKSKDMETFTQDLNNSKVMGKLCGSREIDYAKLCKNLNIPIKEKEENNGLTKAA